MIITEKDNLDRVHFEMIVENSGALFGINGIAYFLTKMLRKGGSLKNPRTKFLQKLEDNAIKLDVIAGREFISISLSFLSEKQKIALNLLEELLTYPNFTEENFKKVKKEIDAERKAKNNNLDYVAKNLLNKISFKNTPLEYPLIGEEDNKISLKDVKEHFKNFFIKENLTFVVGGNFKKIDFDRFTNLFPNGKRKPIPFFEPVQSFGELKRETEQAYIYFNSPYRVDKESRYLAKVATFILGSGGFGSRVVEEIRVKHGLAYSAYVSYQFNNYTKNLNGHMQTKLENEEFAIEKLKELISTFIENGVEENELQQAKNFLIGSEPLRNEVMGQRLILKFLEYYNGFEKGYYKKELQKIEQISLDEINRFIKNHSEILDLSFAVVKK